VRRPPLGQHFLVDASAQRRIADAAAPQPGEGVLEIGPGRGALTAELVRRAGRIAAVELDPALVAALRVAYGPETLHLFAGDVLDLDLSAVREALGAGPLVVVGNLPYQVSKPVAMKLVRERAHVARAVLMFQREVALRLTARPPGRDYAALSVLCGRVYAIERLFDLPPGAFRPRPRVDSSVTRWRPAGSELTADDERQLRACLAACFAQRRRTLRANLTAAFGDRAAADALLVQAEIDGHLRAEQVPPEALQRLAQIWPSPGRALV